ncbi:MAG: anthranilate synthase component I family protein [Chlamydiia bacterium]|nr:anthranilate synthase component I family protein [Chlamydiia bacterium]
MFNKLSFEDFHQLSLAHKRVALFQDFSADLLTPMGAVQSLKKEFQSVVLLESGEQEALVGRYSHIGFNPVCEIRANGFEIHVKSSEGEESLNGDPFAILRKLRLKYSCGSALPLKGFCGGAAGYLAYDAIRYFEDIPDKNIKSREFPDLFFQFYNQSITFDHVKGQVEIVVIVDATGDLKQVYNDGCKQIELLYKKISSAPSLEMKQRQTFDLTEEVKVIPDDASFTPLIEKAKAYIHAGDAFQIVLSRRFEVQTSAPSFDLYRVVRHLTPSPYMFYFSVPDFALVGASPEKLVSVRGRQLETIPLAGTRPRGKDVEEDLRLEEELLNDPKEVAEHMMLVDLGRNDLGAVSKPGTVKVEKLKFIQRFSHVMHIASLVRGELRSELDALDALKATFPAGTLSGAPKIRAMEIIDELESTRRGPYGGAICFLDNQGNLESCIGIRMATLKEGKAVVQTGMGIVNDSIPSAELEETRAKARGMLAAIQAAEEGIL